jgi:HD superfamily phosphodiesterase
LIFQREYEKPDLKAMLNNRKVFLQDIVDTKRPDCVIEEVKVLMKDLCSREDMRTIQFVHFDTVRLYNGDYIGYRKCSTGYHDLKHSMEVFLAMARAIHGASLMGEAFKSRDIAISLVSALLHDSGYIQKDDDTDGTGAKYTDSHVQRSVEFMRRYSYCNGIKPDDFYKARCLIESTALEADFELIPYTSRDIKTLGKMLFAADMVGQMSDRTYLEKLSLLYDEFVEGNFTRYRDVDDLLRHTVSFITSICERISTEVEGLYEMYQSHFQKRCNINRDLYSESMESNMKHLKGLLHLMDSGFHSRLRRAVYS